MSTNKDDIEEHKSGDGIKIPQNYIRLVDGRPMILFAGLLDVAHQIAEKEKGHLCQLNQTLVQLPTEKNGLECIIQTEWAVRVVDSKTGLQFSLRSNFGVGDANPKNVNSFVVKHLIRMAATRANARAFRLITNIGMTAFEELGDMTEIALENEDKNKKPYNKKPERKTSGTVNTIDDKQRELRVQLGKIKKIKKLTDAQLKDSVSKILNRTIKSSLELNSEDLQKVIDAHSKEESKITTEKQEKPADPIPQDSPDKADRKSVIVAIKATMKEKNITGNVLKGKIKEWYSELSDNVKVADLNIEQLKFVSEKLKE